jgi:hypothetical protein
MAKQNEISKVSITIIGSLIVGIISMTLVGTNYFNSSIINSILIPVIAYGVALAMSAIYQYTSCNKVNMIAISTSDLVILGTNSIACLVLYLESFPFLKYIFGTYAPRNPITGLPYEEGSKEYDTFMTDENHYKIQFFSSIVKAVIPVYVSDNVKTGLVYLYWTFWLTMLPLYFMLSVQGAC